ncbi:MAG: hypothetical protein ABFR62_07005 [Bacteroidota bacterium]
MDYNYATTVKKRLKSRFASDRLYSKIKKALTLDELNSKYPKELDTSKVSA